MNIRRKRAAVRVVLFVSIWLAGCMFSVPIDVTGQWIGTLRYTTGPASGFVYPLVMAFAHTGTDLTGTITLLSHSTLTFELQLTSGRAKTPNIRLEASGTNPHIEPPPTVSVTMEGTYDAQSMSGVGTQTIVGVTYEFAWEASFVAPVDPPSGEDQ